MAVDARAPRRRGRLRRALPLVFGLPLLALVITAMYWHSVLASALTPTRPSAAVVAVAPVTDRDAALTGDGSDVAGPTTVADRHIQSVGTADGYVQTTGDEHATDRSAATVGVARGVRPPASGPRAPPQPAA
jgi:hypothetical protein